MLYARNYLVLKSGLIIVSPLRLIRMYSVRRLGFGILFARVAEILRKSVIGRDKPSSCSFSHVAFTKGPVFQKLNSWMTDISSLDASLQHILRWRLTFLSQSSYLAAKDGQMSY